MLEDFARPPIAAPAPRSDPKCPVATTAPLASPSGGVPGVLVRLPVGAVKGPVHVPTTPLVIEQRGCAYVPHVAGLVRGQRLELRSADGTLHNVHAWRDGETEFNLAQPVGAPAIVREIDAAAGEVLRLSCDVHPWMAAHIVVMDHPHFTVTGPDGAFALDGLAPGKHTLQAWHPTLGTRELEVTVIAGKPAKVRIVYPAPHNPVTMTMTKKTQP